MAAPETQGFDSVSLASAVEGLGDQPGGHAVVIVRDGAVVLDVAVFPYDGSTPHQVGAITRVVLTTLVGIAIDRGLMALDDPVLSYFPERTIANRDAAKERITVRHLATLTSGLACAAADESTLHAMEASPDWVRFALDLPVTAEPGSSFGSCGSATHLLAAVLQAATGVSALEFARQFLFEPLGISTARWSADALGVQHGWSDLYLAPRDLSKLGVLWLRGGRWGDDQLVSSAWIRAATGDPVHTGGADYGMGWHVSRDEEVSLEATGHGGQLLRLCPDIGLVIVTAGSGWEPDRAVDPFLDSLVSQDRPLLTDPLGEASLAAAKQRLRDGPDPVPASAPASAVRAVSGVDWVIEANPLGLETVRLDLTGSDGTGTLRSLFADSPVDQVDPIGLDGRYRLGLDHHRRPVALRGAWENERTFVLDVDEVADGRSYTLRLTFAKDGEGVIVEGIERGHVTWFVVGGRPARPTR